MTTTKDMAPIASPRVNTSLWRWWSILAITGIAATVGIFSASVRAVGWKAYVSADLRAHPTLTGSWTELEFEKEVKRGMSPEAKTLTYAYLIAGQIVSIGITAVALLWILGRLGTEAPLSAYLFVVSAASVCFEVTRAVLYGVLFHTTALNASAVVADSPFRLDLSRLVGSGTSRGIYLLFADVSAIRGIYWLAIAVGLSLCIPRLRLRHAIGSAATLFGCFTFLHVCFGMLY